MIRRRTTPLAYTNALYSALLILVLGSAHPVLAAEQAATLSSTDEFQSGSDFTDRSKLPGASLYQKHCASCHLGQVYKAPHQSWLEMMPQGALYRTMSEGIMAPQAAKLSNKQRIAIIEYLRASLEPGGDPAFSEQMGELYSYMERRIFEANAQNDEQGFVEVQGLLREVEEGWSAIPAEYRG